MKKIEETIQAVRDWVKDFVDKSLNKAEIYINQSVEELENEINPDTILRINGNGSRVTSSFYNYSSRTLPTSGETLQATLGKIRKYLTDLQRVAFTGSYIDLVGVPLINYCQIQNDSTTVAYTDELFTGDAASNARLIIGYGGSVSTAGVRGAMDFSRAYLVVPKIESDSVSDGTGRSFMLLQLGSVGSTTRFSITAVAATSTVLEYVKLTIPKGSFALIDVYSFK